MLLCDIGNTSYHFYDLEKDYKIGVGEFDPKEVSDEVYYICVHPVIKKQLKSLHNWIDLEAKVDRSGYYDTMGIDRIVATKAIRDGVVVDAGSAITVDVVKDGVFEGGFIYPGFKALESAYSSISKALAYPLDLQVSLSKLPKSTQGAISYGVLATLVKEITSYNLDIILTGGDAKILHRYIPTAKIDDLLLFRGMLMVLGRELC